MEHLAKHLTVVDSHDERFGPVRRVSPSQIEKFLRCSQQWHYKYVDKLDEPQGVDQILGSAVHHALAVNYAQKVASRVDLPVADVADAYYGDVYQNGGAHLGSTLPAEQVRNLVQFYMAEVAPTIQPLLVEHRFEIPLTATRPDGTIIPFVFNGVMDLVTDTGIIRDHKVKGKPTAPRYVHEDIQMTSYSTAFRILFREREAAISYDQLIKSSPPRFMPIATTRTAEQCQKFMGIMRDVVVRMDAGEHTCNPDHFLCDPRWCSHWDRCPKDSAL